ncbi:hypothetical protein HALLA_10310 [Halostagnicola larsenii XH-48]|uniref:Uncharacterized protein n=1 Tax=Halostagnicola larsenii XH-48 TaxID=797299 RepID=W0JKB9_9EURY|nr:hypothetical protein [Halostagnicola larsenii]AHF99185.1 hypothetical protein HALLA_10310 [Halostagnicola larsenii XH-48]
MYAVDNLSDAIDATREFLTPISLGLVLRLALIVFFVSSLGFSGPGIPFGDVGMVTDETPQSDVEGEFQGSVQEQYEQETGEEFPMDEVIAVALVLAAISIGIWLIFGLITAIMEFVFIESLRSEEVHVRQYFLENLGRGFRLFVFRVIVNAVPVAIVGGLLYYELTGGDLLDQLTGATLWGIVVLGVVFALVYSIILRFTSEFVAPIMLLEERGVLSAWGQFWSTFKANWSEYVVYLVLAWILLLVITITAWFVFGIAAIVLAIPFVILAFVLFAVLAELGLVGGILFTLFMVAALVTFLLLLSIVWTPITVYFRYYALLLLGDTNADLDLVPDLRAALRGNVTGAASGASTAGQATDSRWDDEQTAGQSGFDDHDDSWSTTDSSGASDDDEFEWYHTDDSADEATGDDSGRDTDTESDREESTDDFEGSDGEAEDDEDDELDDRGW